MQSIEQSLDNRVINDDPRASKSLVKLIKEGCNESEILELLADIAEMDRDGTY